MSFSTEQVKLFMTFWNIKKDREWAHVTLEDAWDEFFGLRVA